jgi:outer membrane receptor for ferrienterochelin and colicin
MKRFNLGSIIVLVLTLVAIGCVSSGSSSQSSTNTQNMTLREHLERNRNVTLSGRNSNTRIAIRGENSLSNPGQQPLFVVDGQKMGRSFFDVASRFTPGQIESVKVLVGAGANMYGGEGGNGVIVIKTNR